MTRSMLVQCVYLGGDISSYHGWKTSKKFFYCRLKIKYQIKDNLSLREEYVDGKNHLRWSCKVLKKSLLIFLKTFSSVITQSIWWSLTLYLWKCIKTFQRKHDIQLHHMLQPSLWVSAELSQLHKRNIKWKCAL